MPISEVDNIRAIRSRLEKRKTEIESQIQLLQQEIEEIVDVITSLERAPKLLEKQSLPQPVLASPSYQNGLTTALRIVIRDLRGKDGDPISLPEVYLALSRRGFEVTSSRIYNLMRREADIKKSTVMFIKGEGFFLVRDQSTEGVVKT